MKGHIITFDVFYFLFVDGLKFTEITNFFFFLNQVYSCLHHSVTINLPACNTAPTECKKYHICSTDVVFVTSTGGQCVAGGTS